jgi:hypothetical protein
MCYYNNLFQTIKLCMCACAKINNDHLLMASEVSSGRYLLLPFTFTRLAGAKAAACVCRCLVCFLQLGGGDCDSVGDEG